MEKFPIDFDCVVVYALAGLVQYAEARDELLRLGSHWVFPCEESRALAEAIVRHDKQLWEHSDHMEKTSPRYHRLCIEVKRSLNLEMLNEAGRACHYIRLVCNAGCERHIAETLRWAAERIEKKDRPVAWVNKRVVEVMYLAQHGVEMKNDTFLKMTSPSPVEETV